MSYSSYSSSSRTVSGPHGKVTTTRTYIDEHGNKRTETTSESTGEGGGFSIGKKMHQAGQWVSDKVSDIGDKIGDVHIVPPRVKFQSSKSKPVQNARYNRGWSSRRKPLQPARKVEGTAFTDMKDQCLQSGQLFEDPDFPAQDTSIFYSRRPPKPFEWRRPSEIVDNPELFVGGASRFDVKQGELGDCWLLAAVACLTTNEKLLYRVVPPDQSFTDNYAGIFVFKFWQFGEWIDVVVDDRLPTFNGRLVFMHSDSNNEFWSALLEKAYAKLCGSYEALKGGATSEALEDFTGGISEMFDFRQGVPPGLFKIMMKAQERNSMMGCSIEALPGRMEAELDNGLIMGHAYSITAVRQCKIKTSRKEGEIPMVRVRNPWGNECEWKGAWSDQSPEWKFIEERERKEMGLTFNHDGEFWMAFTDFVKHFQKLEVVHLGVDGLEAGLEQHWESKTLHGEWKNRVNAGGCRNYLETFWTNPQYQVEVQDVDDDEDDLGTLIVGLMQKNRRKMRKEGQDLLTMGYVIYKLDKPDPEPLDVRFFKYHSSVAKSPSFINLREICGRHQLEPGCYCIVPSTFEPGQEGEFVVRIYSEKPNASKELDEETGVADVQPQVEVTSEDRKQEDTLRAAFKKVAGEDLEIDAYELKGILDAACKRDFEFEGFSNETCRSMVAMMDLDQSGKLGFDEFKKVWTDVRLWKTVFKQFDADKSGNLNSFELRRAFHGIGFRVSNGTFNCLVQRYSRRGGKIEFDDFIHCVVRMKTMFDIFKSMSTNGGKAEFTVDQFIQTTMYS